jgi:lipopolysaccharide heptosyltransferase II
VKRFVVVAPNWLGDAVMALPAIADVRRGQPDASIAVAARPSVAPLFTLVPGVDEVVALADAVPSLLADRDVALLLPNSFRSALMARRAGVRERWGYSTDWRGLLLTRGVPRPPSGLHQIDYYQHLVRALGFPTGPAAPRLDVPPALRESGASILRRAGWDGRTPIVALAPGAAFGSAKQWPPSSFADLAVGLADEGVACVVVGAAADRGTADEVSRAIDVRTRPLDLVGQTDVPALAGVLASCRALVANDSGALHLAAAIGVSVTAMFGPMDERLTAPRAASLEPGAPSSEVRAPSRVAVLTHPVWCRPCMLRECPLDHACMKGIDVPRVLDETRRML